MKNIDRKKFLASSAGFLGLANLGFNDIKVSLIKPLEQDFGKVIRLKGRKKSIVTGWDVVTIGNLSRNRYWGESDERAIHKAICTCSIISGKDFNLIVDPSLEDEAAMVTELERRTGLTPEKINAVFITHQHGDHVAGLKHFKKARWFAGKDVAAGLNNPGDYSREIESAGDVLFNAIDVILTPGHTTDHHSLRFDFRGLSVVVAGDSVATKDFWIERRAYYNAIDPVESRQSMEKINSIADVIVPGHDNYFFNF